MKSSSDQDSVFLAVSDEGHGIESENLEKIFDPFFTTKDTGEGTGLGLSICLNIIQASGGSLDVDTQPGAGSTFTINLPLLKEAEEIVR